MYVVRRNSAFTLNLPLLLPTEASENHSQSCICSYFHLHWSMHLSAPGLTIVILYLSVFLRPGYLPFRLLNAAARLIARLPRYYHISSYIKEHLHWLPISTHIEHKVLLIVQTGWHLIIFVMPSDSRPLPHPFVLYAPLISRSSLSLGLGQLWLNLDPFRLLALPFGIGWRFGVSTPTKRWPDFSG